MAITSWTSEGMDWSSVEKIKLGSLYNHLEAIRLAAKEKVEAISLLFSGAIISLYLEEGGILHEDFEMHNYPIDEFKNGMMSVFDRMGAYFVDATDYPDGFDGVSGSTNALAIHPYLDSKDCAALLPSSRWIFNAYSFLNKCRYPVKVPDYRRSVLYREDKSSGKADGSFSSANAFVQSDYNNKTWNTGYATIAEFYSLLVKYSDLDDPYNVSVHGARIHIDMSIDGEASPYPFDLYGRFSKLQNRGQENLSTLYGDLIKGGDVVYDKYFKRGSDTYDLYHPLEFPYDVAEPSPWPPQSQVMLDNVPPIESFLYALTFQVGAYCVFKPVFAFRNWE